MMGERGENEEGMVWLRIRRFIVECLQSINYYMRFYDCLLVCERPSVS